MWAALASLIAGLGIAGYNAYKKNQERKKLDSMPSVFYDIPQGYADNVGLTASQAQSGYDPETINQILSNYSAGLGAYNANVLQAGGGANDIAKGYANYTDSLAKLALQDSELQYKKMQDYLQAVSTYAGQEALQWKLNKYDKDRDNRAAANALIQGYGNAVNSGLNTAIGGAVDFGKGFKEWEFNKNSNGIGSDIAGNKFFRVSDYEEKPIVSPEYVNDEEAIFINKS